MWRHVLKGKARELWKPWKRCSEDPFLPSLFIIFLNTIFVLHTFYESVKLLFLTSLWTINFASCSKTGTKGNYYLVPLGSYLHLPAGPWVCLRDSSALFLLVMWLPIRKSWEAFKLPCRVGFFFQTSRLCNNTLNLAFRTAYAGSAHFSSLWIFFYSNNSCNMYYFNYPGGLHSAYNELSCASNFCPLYSDKEAQRQGYVTGEQCVRQGSKGRSLYNSYS